MIHFFAVFCLSILFYSFTNLFIYFVLIDTSVDLHLCLHLFICLLIFLVINLSII